MARTSSKRATHNGSIPPATSSLYVSPMPIDETLFFDGSEHTMIGGLHSVQITPRRIVGDARWALSLRNIARIGLWGLPVAALLFAIGGMWGWPEPGQVPGGQSPGTWLVVTIFAMMLGLFGMIALAALVSPTTGRRWGIAALVFTVIGTVLFAPVTGVIGLARPAVSRAENRIGGPAAADLEHRLFDSSVIKWLVVGGLVLLACGWFAAGCAVLACGVLNRVDGFLLLGAVSVAVLGAYLSWQFLLVIAAMMGLAAGLGLSWTACWLSPDWMPPDPDEGRSDFDDAPARTGGAVGG
jgi:hypothetical protein